MSRKCDGAKHCRDGSDETACPETTPDENSEPKCAPLVMEGESSKITCSNSTECTYLCTDTSMKFTVAMSERVEVVSEMGLTCDPATSRWSHVTNENPLGDFPSCRG